MAPNRRRSRGRRPVKRRGKSGRGKRRSSRNRTGTKGGTGGGRRCSGGKCTLAKPKVPPTMFAWFVREYARRPNVKKSKLTGVELFRQAAKEWRKMDDKAKKKYQQPDNEEKTRYTQEVRTWKASQQLQKKAPNGYILFARCDWHARRAEVRRGRRPGFATMSRHCASDWSILSQAEKDVYFQESRRHAQEHSQLMSELEKGADIRDYLEAPMETGTMDMDYEDEQEETEDEMEMDSDSDDED